MLIALFIDTTVYYIAMSFVIVCVYWYIVEYLLDNFSKGIKEISFDYEARTISGRNAWLRRSIAMVKNPSGDVVAFTNVKDISASVEQRVREEAYMGALVTEYDSIAIVDISETDEKDSKVVLHSRLTDKLAALLDEETAKEKNFYRKLDLLLRFIHPDDRERVHSSTRRAKVLESFAENRTHNVDFRLLTKDGSYIYFQLCFIALRDEAGTPNGVIAGIKNIDADVRKDLDARQNWKMQRLRPRRRV